MHFLKCELALKNGLPQEMTLKDNFGQETRLSFENFKINVKLQASDFVFKIPKGVEVLKDSSSF